MNILLVGSGGREHALCWALAASPLLTKLWCAPGNPGTAQTAENVAIKALEENADGAPKSVVDRLRALVDSRSNNAWERLGSQQQETPSAAYGRLRREMIGAERRVFKIARNEGRIPEEVLTRAQGDLDLEESLLQRSDD